MIHEVLRGIDKKSPFDVCIIGSGPAGLAIASELDGSSLRVCVLEQGSEEKISENASGLDRRSLEKVEAGAAISTFGGTGTVWRGRLAKLDPIDFMKRDWIPNSGWPITFSSVLKYYERAYKLFGTDDHHRHAEISLNGLESKDFLDLNPKCTNFGKKFKKTMSESENISVFLNTKVSHFEIDQALDKVTDVVIKSHEGNQKLTAQYFILATGGLGNARLMLLSDKKNGNFLTRKSKAIGKFYMNHPKGKAGIVMINSRKFQRQLKDKKIGSHLGKLGLTMSPNFQKKAGILNSHIFLEEYWPELESEYIGMLGEYLGKGDILNLMPTSIEKIKGLINLTLVYLRKIIEKNRLYVVRNYMEQEPSEKNFVELSDEKDKYGLPKIHLNWSISPLEQKTIFEIHRVLYESLTSQSLGRSIMALGALRLDLVNQEASHHLGTTRMGTDPKTSVVDKNCKVHGIKNLYISGGSVFPTSGNANPTLSIVALSIRLSDHLKQLNRI